MSIVVNSKNELYKHTTTTGLDTRRDIGYAIELITGEKVTGLLLDRSFQKSWDMLFECCTWATVFQSRSFVAAWYRLYGQKHLPILVKATAGGQLKGLLAVALLDPDGRITGAGHYDAEYQSWLAEPADGDVFIKKALAELMKQFPGHPISFRYLPPETPLTWINEDATWRRYSIVESYARPLIDLTDPGFARSFRRQKAYKKKLSRLQKCGNVEFERITDVQTFESSLHEMAIMYDFRHGALFNKNHFKEDPVKKDFLVELFRLGLLHTTVLKLDGKIIAAIVAIAGKEVVHLGGINCHSPFNATMYSPGFLHFVLLAKLLAEEHIPCFDLTPGYDVYKEDLANRHDEVKELLIIGKLSFRIKKKIKKWIHIRLVAAGIRPMTAELTGKKYFYLLRHWSAASIIKRLIKRFHKKRKQKRYLVQEYTLRSGINLALHTDSLTDLLQFKSRKKIGVTRWEFLEDANHRLEKGQHCFTCIENDRLLCCAWFSYPDAADNAMTWHGWYCDAAGRDRLSCFFRSVIDAAVNTAGRPGYWLADDPLFCQALEAAGFAIV